MSNDLFISVALFAVVLALLVFLRAISRGRVDAKIADAAIATVPVLIYLVIAGPIERLGVGAQGIDLILRDAAATEIEFEEVSVSFERVDAQDKVAEDSDEAIATQRIVERKAQAMSLTLGSDDYAGAAIRKYLEDLTRYQFFKYLVVLQSDGEFFGMFEARQLLDVVGINEHDWAEFENWIKNKDADALSSLSGFVAASSALPVSASRREALRRMEQSGVDWIPVTNGADKLAGVVTREMVTSSLLLDIISKITPEGESEDKE